MPSIQFQFDFAPRTKLRLSDVEELLRKYAVFATPLSRDTLIEMCQDGTFETVGNSPTRFGWLVYADSFEEWVRRLDEPVMSRAA